MCSRNFERELKIVLRAFRRDVMRLVKVARMALSAPRIHDGAMLTLIVPGGSKGGGAGMQELMSPGWQSPKPGGSPILLLRDRAEFAELRYVDADAALHGG